MIVTPGPSPVASPLRWIVAGNRFGAHRTISVSTPGNKVMSGRLHRSPPADLTALRVVYPWYTVDTAQGEIGTGGTATVSAGLEFPLGTAAGTARAFRFSTAFTGTLADFQTLVSDYLPCLLPAGSLYRLRSYAAPSGYAVLGRPSLGAGGGSMAGYGGAVDDAVFSSSATDLTQVNTAIPAYTNDSAYEPVLVGQTAALIDCWLMVGDSITAGNADITASSGASDPGAGDTYGNAGYAERAAGIKDVPYLNLAKSGSAASAWVATAERRVGYFQQFCNKGLLALGRNDLGVSSASQIIGYLTTIYQRMRANFSRVVVSTIVPATTTTDGGVTLANQAVQPYEGDRQTVNAWIRSGALIPTADVFDFEAVVCDTSTGEILWRVDGGPWSTTGLHPTRIAHIFAATALAALI